MLLAVDEWRDDEQDRHWLPSFVQWRDPAVVRIIDSAERYLRVLLDDGLAGFDGYQSAGSYDKPAREELIAVDRQVQAIWYSLLHDLPLRYINPPPVASQKSQRLRTPSAVLQGRRGTCIDLAMLLAACLEYIGFYPVIFLLRGRTFPDECQGHAFPGYWRSAEAHQKFQVATNPPADDPGTTAPEHSGGEGGQKVKWRLTADFFTEIMACVNQGDLVPLESVALTRGGGFQAALQEGFGKLKKKCFDAMIDLTLARDGKVTPLPVPWDAGP
jgi:hypothetical protein